MPQMAQCVFQRAASPLINYCPHHHHNHHHASPYYCPVLYEMINRYEYTYMHEIITPEPSIQLKAEPCSVPASARGQGITHMFSRMHQQGPSARQ